MALPRSFVRSYGLRKTEKDNCYRNIYPAPCIQLNSNPKDDVDVTFICLDSTYQDIAMKSSFQFMESLWGGWWPATRFSRASQTCSIGLMSGEHAGHSIRTIPSSKRKSYTRLARCGLQLSPIKMKSSPIAAA
ncbi:hypothetical protein TNCV_4708271 [Trichonephila clavipes]|nr:hypothetical protein TNCV_4708271 [Trichonephila clavipes]